MQQKNKAKREIESFELTPNYYNETFVNGNKTHMVEELCDLAQCSLPVFLSIFSELEKPAKDFFMKKNTLR